MRKIQRSELLDFQTYAEKRDQTRPRVLEHKTTRRVHVGPFLTFLFENTDTLRYQVQEMMLAERLVKEAEIQHELDTYNELIGPAGTLPATLLIEIENAERRPELLARWLELPSTLYAKLPDGTKVTPRFDQRQVDEHRLSSVHYLVFDVKGQTPVAIGTTLRELAAETVLTNEQKASLAADLAAP
ncbi:MAG: DUF3501 family protein [Myxococcaceae bacterium]|nr:DUF3501 family protein [Myxococcaceae bacterium]